MTVTGTGSAPPRPRGSAPEVVRAAGAVCWQVAGGALSVLLVHRPRYDDWSWPKGKLDDAELGAAAAVREVEEETGVRVRLGIPLPSAHYRLSDAADKSVSYWAAQVRDAVPPPCPRPEEVDRAEWVTPEEADDRLTRRGDRAQLQAVVEAYAEGRLETFPLLVIRHGHARPKHQWGRPDADRPLVEAGRRQAEALSTLLEVWHPERVVTSPWERCTASVQPYVQLYGVRCRSKGRLTEDGHRRNPAKVSRLVSSMLAKQRPAAVCTHRPVLGTLLGTLAGNSSAGVGDSIPRSDPFLEPGEVLVAHVSRRSGRVVAVERHATP